MVRSLQRCAPERTACTVQVKLVSTALVAALVAVMVIISKKLPKHGNAWLTTCQGQQLAPGHLRAVTAPLLIWGCDHAHFQQHTLMFMAA